MEKSKLEPYTLICLYLNTLNEEEMRELQAISGKYCDIRYDSAIINSLEKQNLIQWDWKTMEVELKEEGVKLAKALIKEIYER
ncbi:MAG: hypothetical protein ACI85I_001933 [Arenicella sp.]|jgi:hypothetical protein